MMFPGLDRLSDYDVIILNHTSDGLGELINSLQ